MQNLAPAHAFRFSRNNSGIWMQWKQWTTDEAWSKQSHYRYCPRRRSCVWGHGALPRIRRKLCQVGNLCSTGSGGSRRGARHILPGACMLAYTTSLSGCAQQFITRRRGPVLQAHVWTTYCAPYRVCQRPRAYAPGPRCRKFPQYIIAHMYPGAHVPNIPHGALAHNRWCYAHNGRRLHSF